MSTQLRYKGRYIKSKVLAKKEKCKAILMKIRQERHNLSLDEKRDISNPCEGNCIVNLKMLGKCDVAILRFPQSYVQILVKCHPNIPSLLFTER